MHPLHLFQQQRNVVDALGDDILDIVHPQSLTQSPIYPQIWAKCKTLCTPFTEREWKTPTDCPGWSVQDQIAHIVGTESWLLGQPVPDHAPKDMRHVKNELGQWIEPWVDRCRPWPGARVLAEFITVTRERWRVLGTMSAEEFSREFHTPIGS